MQMNPNKTLECVAGIQNALNQAETNRVSAMQLIGNVLAAKLRSLKAPAGTSTAKPLSASAKARIARFQNLHDAVASLALYDQSRPAPAPEALVIHGRVTDSRGQPLTNYKLKLSDAGQVLKDRIQPAPSDSQGFFTLTLRGAEFPDLVKNKTDIFIAVTDAGGREIYKPAEPVQLNPGQVAVFSIVDSAPRKRTK